MTSPRHHLHHYNHHPDPLLSSTTTSCHCFQPHHPSPPPPPPPPPLSSSTTTTTFTTPPPQLSLDQLLQLLSSLLHQQQQQQQSNLCSCNNQKHRFQTHSSHFQQQQILQDGQFVLSSLSKRISDLESALHYLSTSKTHTRQVVVFSSLKDAAARVIQTHFRSFLARRSMTLRQLKELAFIKSSFNSLKSSVSNNPHFDFDAVSHKTMEFLLKVDSIQGSDPTIRDGKRSMTRDLARFLDFIDGVSIKRHDISHKSPKSVRLVEKINRVRALNRNRDGGDLRANQREIVEKFRDKAEKIREFSRICKNDEDPELKGFQQFFGGSEENSGIRTSTENPMPQNRNRVLLQKLVGQPRVKKSVSFAENGNLYKVLGETGESVPSEDGSISDGTDSSEELGELIENHFVSGDKQGEPHLERAGSVHKSDGERNLRGNVRNDNEYEINLHCHDQDGNLVFSAPMPMKMEPRADLSKNINAVKTGY